jgi:hypothetical protein
MPRYGVNTQLQRRKAPGLRFMEHVAIDSETGCWLWTASLTGPGYGQFKVHGRLVLAHRFAYELVHGPIPADRELDHLCRVRRCVNPTHLEPVTTRENLLRGQSFAAINARKTHCPAGHPYAGANVWRESTGARKCRTCKQARQRAWRHRKQRGVEDGQTVQRMQRTTKEAMHGDESREPNDGWTERQAVSAVGSAS